MQSGVMFEMISHTTNLMMWRWGEWDRHTPGSGKPLQCINCPNVKQISQHSMSLLMKNIHIKVYIGQSIFLFQILQCDLYNFKERITPQMI